MKRLLMMLLAMILMIPVALAEGENTLLRHAVELGWELDKLAEDEDHIAKYAVDEAVHELIRQLAAGDRTTPSKVLALDFSIVNDMISPDIADLPELAQRSVMKQVPGLLMSSMANAYGVRTAAAFAVVRASDVFAASDVAGQGLWLLNYEDASPVAVAWYAENGAVAMEAAILMPDAEEVFGDIETMTYVVAAARPELDAYAETLATELQELAGNGQYLMLFGLPAEVLSMAKAYVAGENTAPQLVLCGLTDDAYAANVCLTQQLAYIGDVALAAAGALHASVIFADPDACGNGLYLFLYEDGAPIIITWKGENGAYHLTAAFQPGEYPASCRNDDDVNAWAQSIGLNVRFQLPGAMLLP